ncbi:hypothetical protein [Nocardia asiatica]|uniref:hypothetical protein n=1 Tax=Nocardia asiatica TaxID=209252 RepID=UPI0012FAC92C|nr:hypothetical protein [Nocardia asiatica]
MTIDEASYEPTVTPEATRELEALAREVAARHQDLPAQVNESSIEGWIIAERPVAIGEDNHERWNWQEVAILGRDGRLHGGRRETTELIPSGLTTDKLSISPLAIIDWDRCYQETPGKDGRGWFRTGNYAVPHYTDRLRRALTRFDTSGRGIGDYRSAPRSPRPRYNRAGVRSARGQFIARSVILVIFWVGLSALMKAIEFLTQFDPDRVKFPPGSYSTIAWSCAFVAVAGLAIDLVMALKADDDRFRDVGDEALPFLMGAGTGFVLFVYLWLDKKIPAEDTTSRWWIVPVFGVVAYAATALFRYVRKTR